MIPDDIPAEKAGIFDAEVVGADTGGTKRDSRKPGASRTTRARAGLKTYAV